MAPICMWNSINLSVMNVSLHLFKSFAGSLPLIKPAAESFLAYKDCKKYNKYLAII